MATRNILPRENGEGNLGIPEQKWDSVNVNTVNTNIINGGEMIGASATEDGNGGIVPKPTAGCQDKYLGGDGKWHVPIDAYTKEETEALVSTKIAEVVANADKDFDTLKEIADWINNDKTRAANLQNEVSNKLDSDKITFGTSDLIAGTSELATNSLYFVYEE